MDELAPVIGRRYLLAWLADEMRFDRVVQLWGAPGVGKTTLLRHAAKTLKPEPDGAVLVSAAGEKADDLVRAVLERGTRVTAYVDDADLPREQLLELTDTIRDATFVFASREATLRGEATVIEVPGLDLAAATELLQDRLPGTLPPSERAGARRLWETTGGNPLLLLQAANTYAQAGTIS